MKQNYSYYNDLSDDKNDHEHYACIALIVLLMNVYIRKDCKNAKYTCYFKNNGGGYDNLYAQPFTHS